MPDNDDGMSVCLYLSLGQIIMKSDLCLDIDLGTNKQADRLIYRHTDMLKEIKKDRHTYRQTGTQTHK